MAGADQGSGETENSFSAGKPAIRWFHRRAAGIKQAYALAKRVL